MAFTHLHTDHTGLGFLPGHGGKAHKAFPHAEYLVARAEWDPFWNGEIAVGAPSWDGFMVPMSRVLRRFDDGEEVWPGVTALVTPGHSPGHTTYVVSARRGRRVLIFGDAFHTPVQLAHPEWPSGPDTDVAGVLKARTTLLAQLHAPRTLGFAFHFGDQTFGRVTATANGARRVLGPCCPPRSTCPESAARGPGGVWSVSSTSATSATTWTAASRPSRTPTWTVTTRCPACRRRCRRCWPSSPRPPPPWPPSARP